MQQVDRPRYGTREYQLLDIAGEISKEQADADRAEAMRHREAAREAQRSGRRAPPKKRIFRPPPKRSRQYAKNHAMAPFLDQRLTMGARICLLEIHAQCGKNGYRETTNASLAAKLGVSPRTVQRWIEELAGPVVGSNGRDPYIIREIATTRGGKYKGIVLRTCRALSPFFKNLRRSSTDTTKAPSINSTSKKEEHPRIIPRRVSWTGYNSEYGFGDRGGRQRPQPDPDGVLD